MASSGNTSPHGGHTVLGGEEMWRGQKAGEAERGHITEGLGCNGLILYSQSNGELFNGSKQKTLLGLHVNQKNSAPRMYQSEEN